MDRLSRIDMLLDVAELISKRGTCQRLTVGAVIAQDGRIISTGYNGAPRGLPHCNPMNCIIERPCTYAAHAELNSITFAARAGVSTNAAEMYCTDSPCIECAKAIINAGIKSVYYRREYRLKMGLQLLSSAQIECHHVEKS